MLQMLSAYTSKQIIFKKAPQDSTAVIMLCMLIQSYVWGKQCILYARNLTSTQNVLLNVWLKKELYMMSSLYFLLGKLPVCLQSTAGHILCGAIMI